MAPRINLAKSGKHIVHVCSGLVQLVKGMSKDVEPGCSRNLVSKIPFLDQYHTSFQDLQQFRIRVGVYVAASLAVQEADELRAVDKVSVDAHGETERGVHVERLGFGPVHSAGCVRNVNILESWAFDGDNKGHGRTYADEVPAVGYLRWAIPMKPGRSAVFRPSSNTLAAMPLPLH